MSTAEIVLVVAAAVLAPVDWVAVWKGADRLRMVTKPAVLVLLVLAAVVAPADATDVQVLTVVALTASLIGDVALQRESLFLVGLAGFLVAHVLYVVAVLAAPDWSEASAVVGAVLAAVVVVTLGVRLERALRSQPGALRHAVRAYVVVILVMVLSAWAWGPVTMAVGAALFVASDSCLGWNRFLGERRWLQLTVMPTYHAGQLLIMLGLLHHVT